MSSIYKYRQEQLAYLRKIESEAEPCALCKEKPEEYHLGGHREGVEVFGCANCDIGFYAGSLTFLLDERFSIQRDIENIEKWNSLMKKSDLPLKADSLKSNISDCHICGKKTEMYAFMFSVYLESCGFRKDCAKEKAWICKPCYENEESRKQRKGF